MASGNAMNFSRPFLGQHRGSLENLQRPPKHPYLHTSASHPVMGAKVSKLHRQDGMLLSRRSRLDNEQSVPEINTGRDALSQPAQEQAEHGAIKRAGKLQLPPNRTARTCASSDRAPTLTRSQGIRSVVEMSFQHGQTHKQRYYRNALSEEDGQALEVGESNHNYPQWGPEDLTKFQESRLDLVKAGPRGREDLIEQRKADVEKSKAYTPSWIEKESAPPSPRRTVSAPASPLPEPSSQESWPLHTKSSQNSFDTIAPPNRTYWRTGDYFSQPKAPLQRTSAYYPRQGQSAGRLRNDRPTRPDISSRRTYSTPAEAREYKCRPEITFDLYLAPHISGKGEAFRGAANAKPLHKPDEETVERTTKSRASRTMQSIGRPSISTLRSRKSRAGLSEMSSERSSSENS